MTATPLVIGLDGGGTYTRALGVDLVGNVLASTQTGGANPSKNSDAAQNLRQAVDTILRAAGSQPDALVAIVAGIAGLDAPEDYAWAAQATAWADLRVQTQCVNDAVVAWAGALGLQPGIVAIAGTGSIIFGVTPTGRQVRNYDFCQYSEVAARFLARHLVHQIVIGATEAADAPLVAQVLEYFQVADRPALATLASTCYQLDHETFVRSYGGLAPLITAAAAANLPVAQRVCDKALADTAIGIQLLGSQFDAEVIRVALAGSVARSPYVRSRLRQILATAANRRYQVVEPLLSPVAGAALMALEQYGVAPSPALLERLQQGSPLGYAG
jgi:glucosamine kinase